jgi:KDO2-lipid IV(A) lauroyltransferase
MSAGNKDRSASTASVVRSRKPDHVTQSRSTNTAPLICWRNFRNQGPAAFSAARVKPLGPSLGKLCRLGLSRALCYPRRWARLGPKPRAPTPRFAHRLEAWGAAFLFRGFKSLPLDCASALGGAPARRIGPFLGVSKHARRNVSRAFPDLSKTEIARVIAGMWDNLGRVAAEYPHLRNIFVFEPGGRVETYGFEHVDRAVAAGRRIMLAGAQHEISVAQIYRALNNPLMDCMIARFRGDCGELIPKGVIAARRAIAALRRGAHLGLLADQKMKDGIAVSFFGRLAMTAPALAILALRFDCDVLPLRVERLNGARFRVTVFPPLPLPHSGEPHADAGRITDSPALRLRRYPAPTSQRRGAGL